MKTAYRSAALLVAALASCDGLTCAPLPVPDQPPAVGTQFDPTNCGTIAGTVRWDGDPPHVPPVTVPQFNLSGVGPTLIPNPNAPLLWPEGGVYSAVVYLRGVDPAKSKPWQLPAVTVEADDYTIRVRQGDGLPERIGFVQSGATLRLLSKGTGYVGIRGRGVGFFSHVFPPDGRPVERTLTVSSRVELSSASGQFWAAAELFVSPTPYFARPERGGGFTLTDVPAGTYELVCWHPNWHPEPPELDPETGAPARRRYLSGVELVQSITVAPKQTAAAEFRLHTTAFVPSSNR